MVGLVIRAIELPISLSVGAVRRAFAVAGSVTGWALSGVQGGGSDEADDGAIATATRFEATTTDQELGPEEAFEHAPATEEEPATADVGPEAGQAEPEEQPTAAQPPAVADSGVEHEPGLGTSVRARDPHSALNNPVTEPDLTEWPDPYDKREDPLDPGEGLVFGDEVRHPPPGAISTSEPHPAEDPEAEPYEGPKRDKLDE